MNSGFDMSLLEPGDVWDLPGGKTVEILGEPFLFAGSRWVPANDYDFDDPRLMKVARFEGGWRRP